MKKFLSWCLVLVLLLLSVPFAQAAIKGDVSCEHDWVEVNAYEHGQGTQYIRTRCQNSGELHSHYRSQWWTTYTYNCTKCGETKTQDHFVYGAWVCTLADPG